MPIVFDCPISSTIPVVANHLNLPKPMSNALDEGKAFHLMIRHNYYIMSVNCGKYLKMYHLQQTLKMKPHKDQSVKKLWRLVRRLRKDWRSIHDWMVIYWIDWEKEIGTTGHEFVIKNEQSEVVITEEMAIDLEIYVVPLSELNVGGGNWGEDQGVMQIGTSIFYGVSWKFISSYDNSIHLFVSTCLCK